jgi:hypothetical protein
MLQMFRVTVLVADTEADHTHPLARPVIGLATATIEVVAPATVVVCCWQVCAEVEPGLKVADVAASGAGVVPAGVNHVPAPLRKCAALVSGVEHPLVPDPAKAHATVPDAVIVPPVNPVPAVMLVTVPPLAACQLGLADAPLLVST